MCRWQNAAGELDHPRRGARLALAWQLEPEMVQAIAGHHDAQPPPHALGEVAWLAEQLAAVFEDVDPAAARTRALAAAMGRGLSLPDVDEILAQLPEQTRKAALQFVAASTTSPTSTCCSTTRARR